MPIPPQNLNEFSSLVQLIKDLRGPEGCEWDKKQTHHSLSPYAIEETFEMVEAIESGTDTDMCEELGDVLFQVLIHAQLAAERNAFQISDVIKSISEKLVRRHPHVFSNVKVTSTTDIINNWELIKAEEKKLKNKKSPVFNIPKGLPALQAAEKIGDKTNQYKFDWTEVKDVLAQLKSEITELEDVIQNDPENKKHLIHETGDVLFSAAQVARHLSIEPESALRSANTRFSNRFLGMLSECGDDLQKFISLSENEKEALWAKVKEQFAKDSPE
jgi:tetrapyrrole methylase family protein/MazG family protein